jgi:hypothetical protein
MSCYFVRKSACRMMEFYIKTHLEAEKKTFRKSEMRSQGNNYLMRLNSI